MSGALLIWILSSAQIGGGWIGLGEHPTPGRILALSSLADSDGDGAGEILAGLSDETVRVFSGRTGAELLRVDAPVTGSWFGTALAPLGDVDGDTFDDFAVGAPFETPGGVVRLYSGATGSVLRAWIGSVVGGRFGWRLLAPGDLDGDLRPDLLIASPGNPAATGTPLPGTLTAVSIATGGVLYTFASARDCREFAHALAGFPDVDRDGVPDYASSMPSASVGSLSQCGEIILHSGADGSILRSWTGAASHSWLGGVLSATGDADGDRFADLYADGGLYSSRSGGLIRRLAGDPPGIPLNGAAAGRWDLTGDGFPDLAIGSSFLERQGARNGGGCFIFDPRDGRIQDIVYGASEESLGAFLAIARGLGGDALPDLALGAYLGQAWHAFGFSSLLRADPPILSASSGGVVALALEFPDAEAGRDYLMLASGSGTGPTQAGGILVPLSYDLLYVRMLAAPPSWIRGARGTLDSRARARAELHVPAGAAASWVGRTTWFAAVTYQSVLARRSSRAVTVTVVP